jgi:hypothetical protein
MANNTAFPVGTYVGGPDGNDPPANAQFEATFDQFSTITGVRPKFMDAFTDNSQGNPSTWVSNAGWAAWSWAKTGSAYVGPGSGIVPVVGIPMSWPGESGSNVDAAYQDIASGKYDAAFKGIVDDWIDEGYKTIQFRIGYEFNIGSIPWAVFNSSAPTASQDFVAAFQRIANIVHTEAKALGATAQVVWNPGTWVSGNTTQLYPGDQYVDVMSLDEYSPTWTTDFTNWAGGGTQQIDSATWVSNPINREHFWQYTNASQQNPTPGLSSPGWSMQDAIAFAKLHNKPLSLSETGAGNASTSPASFGPLDDPDFPIWLNSELSSARASGVTIQNVDIWDVGNVSFNSSTRPMEAAAWAKYFGSGSVASSGSPPPIPTISLSVPGTVPEAAVGAGVTISEIITTTNITGPVYEEVLTASGAVESGYKAVALTKGAATVSVFLAKSGDKVQVVDNPTSPTVIADSSPVTITDPIVTPPPTVTIGSGPDTLALQVSEDAYLGNALFTVSVDGKQIGGTQTATALHSSGQTQTFDVLGTFAAGSHTATVDFLNDAYGGSPTTDRNLYVDGATIDGSVVPSATLTEHFQGPQSFTFLAPGTSGSKPAPDIVTLNRPASLTAGQQTIAGAESDPTQPVFVDWRTYGIPALDASDWVQATVNPSGQFTASVLIDHPGIQSTMFYHAGSGPIVAAWSATPT